MAVRFGDRLGGLTQVVEMAQLVRHARQRLGHRLADRLLAVRDNAGDGHGQGVAHLAQERAQILGGSREQAPGQQELARQAITQHPQDLVADIGL